MNNTMKQDVILILHVHATRDLMYSDLVISQYLALYLRVWGAAAGRAGILRRAAKGGVKKIWKLRIGGMVKNFGRVTKGGGNFRCVL